MANEYEYIVDYDIPVEDLNERLNEIHNYPDYNDGKFIVPFFPEVKETLAAPDGTYTILWFKRSNVWIHERIEEFRRALAQVAKDGIDFQRRREAREVEAKDWPVQEQIRIDNEWNSRSIWYQLFHSKPVVDLRDNPYRYSAFGYYRDDSNRRALESLRNRLQLKYVIQQPKAEAPPPRRPLSDPTQY